MIWQLFVFVTLAVAMRADEGQKEYVLFNLSDGNHDMMLTRTELDDIFLLFDADNNTEITEAEFVFDWENKFNLGNGEEARALFSKADIDDDGVIDSNDIPGIFTFFDTNGDGEVDINEFLTQWGYLEKNPNNTVDVNVSVDFDG